jgi:hypothetical protein
MKKNLVSILPKSCCFTKKAINRFFHSHIVLLFTTVFVLSASAVAQNVNYNLPQNWMCHPVLKTTDVAREQNLALTVKNQDLSIDTIIHYAQYAGSLVDIFYIYPTIDMTFSMGNTAMGSIDTVTAKFVYREQVGILSQFGRVFVPYYRQAKIGVFVDPSISDSVQLIRANCLEAAYNDVDSAFNNYLKHYNNGRKIILIGHSQGALMMRFLLRKRFDNNPALMSQLVVAISAGEPNYVSANGSRTGGSLQNIKTCPPRDSVQECGCIMNWRTWNKQYPVETLKKISFFFSQHYVDKGLIYQIYDTINNSHIESSYDFGYNNTQKIIPRFITFDSTMTNYLAFDNLFKAEITSDPGIPGSAYLWIDSNFTPNDQRKTGPFSGISPYLQCIIPIPPTTKNYHIWDMQFVLWDLMNILPELIEKSNSTGISEEKPQQNNTLIYPNPTSGIVHVTNAHQKIENIRLYDIHGNFINEYFNSDFSVSDLPDGIYFIKIQTDNSSFINKLIKQ